jgi:hypothetical protein
VRFEDVIRQVDFSYYYYYYFACSVRSSQGRARPAGRDEANLPIHIKQGAEAGAAAERRARVHGPAAALATPGLPSWSMLLRRGVHLPFHIHAFPWRRSWCWWLALVCNKYCMPLIRSGMDGRVTASLRVPRFKFWILVEPCCSVCSPARPAFSSSRRAACVAALLALDRSLADEL